MPAHMPVLVDFWSWEDLTEHYAEHPNATITSDVVSILATKNTSVGTMVWEIRYTHQLDGSITLEEKRGIV